jgi:hypothetical protein
MTDFKTKNMKNTEKDISRIIKHNKALESIPFVINQKDVEGYLYCIENKLFDGYNQPIYKISSTVNIENMLDDHNTTYFEKCNLIKQVKVPRKLFYEFMIILRLHKYRVSPTKNFYINLKKINKAFDELDLLLKTKTEEEIHNFYLNYFNSFDPKTYCITNLEIAKVADYLPEIKLSKKKSMKINLNMETSGYIYWIEHPYIKRYFNNKIQIIIPSISEEVPWIKSNFLEDIKIIKVFKIQHFGIGKNMFYELAYLNNIKGCYYQISKEQIIKLFDLIEKYFNTYPDIFQLNFAFGQRALK